MRIRMCRSSTWSMTCARNGRCPATRCSRSCWRSTTPPARTWTCPARPSASCPPAPRPPSGTWSSAGGKPPDPARLVAGRLVRVLEQVAADPGLRVHQVSLLSDAERAELAARNQTAAPVPDDTATGMFADRARRVPDAVAVTDGEAVVAVMVPRSAGMVTAVLGVLWAGAAYLPLDPGYPPERISFMLTNAGAV